MVPLYKEELFFEILYVMTESVGAAKNYALQWTLFLFWIDVAQVLRVITSPVYGWSEDSYQLTKHIDIIYVVGDLISRAIPRYSLFILSSFLVLLALGDTVLAARQFQHSGKMTAMWPIKLLRLLVNSTVTILFASVIKWLLMPMDCLVSNERSISSYLHNEPDRCTPWDLPDLFLSSFTVVTATFYIIFAVFVSFLNFETNLLARGPRSLNTGSVEATWILSKVAVTVLAYLAAHIHRVTCAVLILLMIGTTLYKHLTVFPFHRHESNLVRGGAFLCVSWLAFATVVVAAIDVGQAMQWILLALIPVFFALGIGLTQWLHSDLDRSIERLRSEYLLVTRDGGEQTGSDSSASNPKDARPAVVSRRIHVIEVSAWDKFFDPTWQSRRAFRNEARAKLVLNTLLYRRDRNDLPFFMHLLARAMQEYPDSVGLRIYEVLIVHFVKKDPTAAAVLERRYQLDHKTLPIDHRFVLFALARTKVKESAGASLGKSTYSVVNVMEFDTGMAKARKAHLKCISAFRRFWTSARRVDSHDRQHLIVNDMLREVEVLDSAIDQANKEYLSLVDMYPSSATLLNTYASFCENILNDAASASKWKTKAIAVENMSGEDVDDDDDAGPVIENDGESSTSGGGGGGGRSRMLALWRETLLKAEGESLLALAWRVRGIMLLVVVVVVVFYFVMDRVLLSGMAESSLDSVVSNMRYEASALDSVKALRDIHLYSTAGEPESAQASRDLIEFRADLVTELHRRMFESMPSSEVEKFFLETTTEVQVPSAAGWREHSFNYWNLINEWARRVMRAVSMTSEEWLDPDWSLTHSSDEKRNAAFIFENTLLLRKTWVRAIDLYQREMGKFADLAFALAGATFAVNAAAIIFLAGWAYRVLRQIVPRVQSKRVAVAVALRAPRRCQNRIRQFYIDLEDAMLGADDDGSDAREEFPPDGQPLQLVRTDGDAASPPPPGLHNAMMGKLTAENLAQHNYVLVARPREPPFSWLAPTPNDATVLQDDGGEGEGDEEEEAQDCEELQEREEQRAFQAKVGTPPPSGARLLRDEEHAGTLSGAPLLACAPMSVPPVDQIGPPSVASSGDDMLQAAGELAEELAGLQAEVEVGTPPRSGSSCDNEASPRPELAHDSEEAEAASLPHDDSVSQPSASAGGELAGLQAGRSRPPPLSIQRPPIDEPPPTPAPAPLTAGAAHQTHPPLGEELTQGCAAGDGEGKAEGTVPFRIGSGGILRRGSVRWNTSDEGDHSKHGVDQPNEEEAEGAGGVGWGANGEQSRPAHRVNSGERPSLRAGSSPLRAGSAERRALERRGLHDENSRASSPMCTSPRADRRRGGRLERMTSSYAYEEAGEAPAMDAALDAVLEEQLLKQRPWHSRRLVWVVVTAGMVLLCMFSTFWPMRALPDMHDTVVLVRYAGDRFPLLYSVSFLARELVLDDGMARMGSAELARTMHDRLEELRGVHEAVRVGGLGIKTGADFRFDWHNDIMYQVGCPWREDLEASQSYNAHRHRRSDDGTAHNETAEGELSFCGIEGWEDAGARGLQYLMNTFMDAAQNVLDTYAPTGYETWTPPEGGSQEEFGQLTTTPEKIAAAEENKDVVFLRDNQRGDLKAGLLMIQNKLADAGFAIMATARFEIRLFFALYSAVALVLWYGVFFRSTIASAHTEAANAKAFVWRLPLRVLSTAEINTIAANFLPPDAGHHADEARDASSPMAM